MSDEVDALSGWKVTVHPDTVAHVRELGTDPERRDEFTRITRDLLNAGVTRSYLWEELGVYVCRNGHATMNRDLVGDKGSRRARCPHCRREANRRYYYAESRRTLIKS